MQVHVDTSVAFSERRHMHFESPTIRCMHFEAGLFMATLHYDELFKNSCNMGCWWLLMWGAHSWLQFVGLAIAFQCLLVMKLISNSTGELHMLHEAAVLQHHCSLQASSELHGAVASQKAASLLLIWWWNSALLCFSAFRQSKLRACDLVEDLLHVCMLFRLQECMQPRRSRFCACPSNTELSKRKRSGQYGAITRCYRLSLEIVCVLLKCTSYFLTLK